MYIFKILDILSNYLDLATRLSTQNLGVLRMPSNRHRHIYLLLRTYMRTCGYELYTALDTSSSCARHHAAPAAAYTSASCASARDGERIRMLPNRTTSRCRLLRPRPLLRARPSCKRAQRRRARYRAASPLPWSHWSRRLICSAKGPAPCREQT